ncbi:MAG: Ig-like domain-containing protein [Bacteroidales bacterium]|nr:Ig-like domain-containing protein [Bacteroidales bacterium]
MKNTFRYILLAGAAMLSLASCEEEVAPAESAVIYSKVEISPAQKEIAKMYMDENDVTVLPLVKGERVTLGYLTNPAPEAVSIPGLIWTSSDESVVSISEDGTITAVAAGRAVITIASEGFNLNATSSIYVIVAESLVKASSITIVDNTTSVDETYSLPRIYVTENCTLTPTIKPADATYKTVNWTSSDNSVATIDPITGVVTGISMGKVSFTATSLDGAGVVAKHEMYIDKLIKPAGIKVANTPGEETFSMSDGEFAFDFTTSPAICTKSLIEWTSSDPAVASVDRGVVKFLQPGTVTISANCPGENPEAGFGKTFSYTFNIPYGFYRDYNKNSNSLFWYLNPSHKNNGGKDVWVEDAKGNYIDVTLNQSNANTGRGDFVRAAPTWISGDYPILCFRIDDVNDFDNGQGSGYFRQITLDCSGNTIDDGTKYSGGINGTNNKWGTKYKCSDKSAILIYDLTTQSIQTGGLLPAGKVVQFATFQLKYADVRVNNSSKPNYNANDLHYRFFWFHTFKTMDDCKAYLDTWSASSGISYE